MLLATPESVRWRRRFYVALALLVASYVWYARNRFPHGGSAIGIAYGSLGLLLILVLAFFGVRKRWYRSQWGTLEAWLQSHVYLGLLSVLVVAFHAGFRFHDKLALATFVVLCVVVVSGAVGAVLYTTLPRLLTEVESNLTVEEISAQLNQLGQAMARMASGRSPALQRVYNTLQEESLPRPLAGWRALLGGGRKGDETPAGDAGLGRRLSLVAAEDEEALRELLVLSRQHKELHQRLVYQQTYKNWLDVWLYIHLPLSVVLLLLVAAHLVAVFYYM